VTADESKQVVRRLIEEVINRGRLDVIDDVFEPGMVAGARGWITPFRESFPDVRMEVVELIAEGDKVVGRFKCSGTHEGVWHGQAPTGRRFEDVDEVYFFRLSEGRIAEAWGLEDTPSRLKQLGLEG
jgi:predicted ester cyclase